MRIVLPGALPDPAEARELLPHLQKAAPILVAWLERSHAMRIVADPAQTYCTAWEYWQLRQHGFNPKPQQSMGSGLGPLLAHSARSAADAPIWLVELAHISPSRDGAVLIPARDLAITQEDSDTLLASTQELFVDTGFSLHPCSTHHWRIELPDDYLPRCPTPDLVATTTVNDWWRQDLDGRSWRRLANEVQMLWFDHAVNQQRFEKGLMPINTVWLFGGATQSQFTRAPDTSLSDVHVDHRLLAPMLEKDWSNWLQGMNELNAELFRSLDAQSEVNLIGHDRIISYTTENRFWKRWQPGTKEAWKKSWSPQN